MRTLLQNLSSGETQIVDVPVPKLQPNEVLIETSKSLISVGTERMLVEFGKANYFNKAKQQPDKVKDVIEKIKTDGPLTTYESVKNKLDQPMTLGYSNVGIVVKCGKNVEDLNPGDRVVSNGPHASMVLVSRSLVCEIPDEVADDDACFTILASIGLQGIRLANPTLGETIVVYGMGLIGLLTVQLLKANGCEVIGIDIDERKLELARSFGAKTVSVKNANNPVNEVNTMTAGRGVDAVLITASAHGTPIVNYSAKMCRKGARIVLVGVIDLDIDRADFYEKEISFQVSCSYGPGRYDHNYEDKLQDYPIGYVRWTENRNFEAILMLMQNGALEISPLITHRFNFSDAENAYSELHSTSNVIGILLDYANEKENSKHDTCIDIQGPLLTSQSTAKAEVGFIGAGNYATRALIPIFKKSGAKLETIVSKGGVSAVHHGRKNGFIRCSTNVNDIVESENINTVVIATRHDSHCEHIINCLTNRKHVFVEKPLALTNSEISEIEDVYKGIPGDERPKLMVGFNRRFSPLAQDMKRYIQDADEPKVILMTMNAGNIPAESWIQDKNIGGGRIIGEACHLVDLMRYLIGSPIEEYSGFQVKSDIPNYICSDKATFSLKFQDGSIGCINYLANGGKTFPKERVEVFSGDGVLQLENFKKLNVYEWHGAKKRNLLSQDKGQNNCIKLFLDSVEKGLESPIPFDEILEVSRYCIDISESLGR